MDKTAKLLLLLTIALEAIGWGLGMTGVISQPLGWSFVGLGGITLLILFVYLFKKEKPKIKSRFQLEAESKEIEARIEEKKEYLPDLKDTIDIMIEKSSELIIEASQLSLNEYRDRYLKFTWQYIACKLAWGHNESLAITNALAGIGFVSDNLYYDLLKESNQEYQQLHSKYSSLYSRVYDKRLKKTLSQL